MPAAVMPAALDHAEHAARTKLLNGLFHTYHEAPFGLRFADGWSWFSSQTDKPRCTLVFKTEAAWRALAEDPTERKLGEAFIDGELEVEGDIFSVFAIPRHIVECPIAPTEKLLRGVRISLAELNRQLHGQRHSKASDRASISYHYDLPLSFYRPLLGPTLVYSCAYFRGPSTCLDCAQIDKLDLICRKLGLRAEDNFLDIGCGWGSLILHAASRYHAESYGITLSREQAAEASRRISQAALASKCSVELRDYRELTSGDISDFPARFDKIASVGMFEHVGAKNLHAYFSLAFKVLHRDGVFLNHGIARSAHASRAMDSFTRDSFIDRYVFPDGELVTLSDTLSMAESVGFEVRDVDNLRSHYARTLRLWVENLQRNAQTRMPEVSERTYRIWLLYLAGSADAFERGDIELYQVLLARPRSREFQKLTTRESWYQGWGPAPSKAAVS